MSSETLAAVMGYFEGWTSNRVDDAYAFLAPDLHFAGPSASYESAEAFRPAPLQRTTTGSQEFSSLSTT